MRDRARLVRIRLVVGWLALGLAACGPGTGGTGLPPGDGGTPTSASSLQTPPSPTPSSSVTPAEPLPSGTPDLAGSVESVDPDAVTIAGRRLPWATISLRDASGATLAADEARVGRTARAWQVGAVWVVALDA